MPDSALYSCLSLLLTELLPLIVIAVVAVLWFHLRTRRDKPREQKERTLTEADLWRLLECEPEDDGRPEKSQTREPQLW